MKDTKTSGGTLMKDSSETQVFPIATHSDPEFFIPFKEMYHGKVITEFVNALHSFSKWRRATIKGRLKCEST